MAYNNKGLFLIHGTCQLCLSSIYVHFKIQAGPGLCGSVGWSIILYTKRLWVWSSVSTCVGSKQLMFLFSSLLFSSFLSSPLLFLFLFLFLFLSPKAMKKCPQMRKKRSRLKEQHLFRPLIIVTQGKECNGWIMQWLLSLCWNGTCGSYLTFHWLRQITWLNLMLM